MKKIFKIKNNSKGFTLIELLAVIVILGILMITAIPAVTKYINNSKKDTFADSALAYINSARYSLLNDEYNVTAPDAGDSVCIPLKYVDIDKATKSSYGGDWDTEKSYVKATNEGGKITYSIAIRDSKNYGTKGGAEVTEDALTTATSKRASITQSVNAINSDGCSCNFGSTGKERCTVSEKN